MCKCHVNRVKFVRLVYAVFGLFTPIMSDVRISAHGVPAIARSTGALHIR